MAVDTRYYPHILAEGFSTKSPEDPAYNCIAWAAAADKKNLWWPPGGNGSYWPPGVPTDVSINAFVAMFKSLQYEECKTAEYEAGYEKVALYANGTVPTHAARQLPSGIWTHKLGKNVDIETTLKGVQAPHYGKPIKYFRRKLLAISN
jgi:hypothetical protein